MKTIKQFKIGSAIFFNNMPDYKLKDNDWLAIADTFFPNKIMMNLKIKNDDIFLYKNHLTKQDFINDAIESKVPMRVGKFLVPEFIQYIGFTIEDLKQLNNIFNQLDDLHKYEKIIYDSYIENNDFILTNEQLNKAYNEYKKYRTGEYTQYLFEQKLLTIWKGLKENFPNNKFYLVGSAGLYIQNIKQENLPADIDIILLENDNNNKKNINKIRKQLCKQYNYFIDIKILPENYNVLYNEIIFNNQRILVITIDEIIKYKIKYMNMYKNDCPAKYQKHKQQLLYINNTYHLNIDNDII